MVCYIPNIPLLFKDIVFISGGCNINYLNCWIKLSDAVDSVITCSRHYSILYNDEEMKYNINNKKVLTYGQLLQLSRRWRPLSNREEIWCDNND